MFRPLRILAAFRTGSATTISKWRIVDRQAQTVGVHWQVEQPLLHPLPAHPFACCVSREVTLNGYGQVTFETNRYSVPADKARKHLTLRTYPFIIEVLADNQLIATHPRSYARQQDILDPLHYLALRLEAADGPLGTRDFRIALELTPAPAGGSFMRLSYSYRYGLAARLALQGYLATLGRDKVGFSIVGRAADGSPIYIEGLRGAVERNTLRYYLAIEAYLGALALPPAQQPESRLQAWFDATERHPLQLHELERDDYLAMKRRELARLAAGSAAAN